MDSIDIKVSGKMAFCKKHFPLSSNPCTFVFKFDEEWKKEKRKKARLIFDGRYIDLPIRNDKAFIKKLPYADEISIGVYSKHLSSTFADIGCIRSSKDFRKGEYYV